MTGNCSINPVFYAAEVKNILHSAYVQLGFAKVTLTAITKRAGAVIRKTVLQVEVKILIGEKNEIE